MANGISINSISKGSSILDSGASSANGMIISRYNAQYESFLLSEMILLKKQFI